MKTTLFIPVRNEIDGVRQIMPQIRKEWVDEIIVIDGNSTDGTYEYFRDNGYHVLKQKSHGLAAAYWEAFEVATGDVMIPFSPDGNSLAELIPRLVEKMKEGYDMVIASRYYGDAKSEDDDAVTAFGNWLFTKMINVLYGAHYTDTLVMFRAFRMDLFKRLDLDEKKIPALEVQLDIRCAKKKLKVADIPGDEPKRIGGVRKMKPLYNGTAVLWHILRELFIWH